MATNNGCTEYKAMQMTIFFYDGVVCCDKCPALETYSRKQCRRTGEYLADTRVTGYECPLVEVKTEETNEYKPEYEPI